MDATALFSVPPAERLMLAPVGTNCVCTDAGPLFVTGGGTCGATCRLAQIARMWARAEVHERRWLTEGRWLRFGHALYRVGDRTYPPWELVERTQRPKHNGGHANSATPHLDAVDILGTPTLLLGRGREGRGQTCGPSSALIRTRARVGARMAAFVYSKAWAVPRLATVVNFRPAVGGLVLELPAGLIDDGETAVHAAQRELREEVGLVGTPAPEALPFLYDPGITNECGAMVRMRVDLDAQREPSSGSIHPGATPEETELVAPVLLPLDRLGEQLRDYHRTLGIALDSRLLAFAHGWDMGRALAAHSGAAAPSPWPSPSPSDLP
jgi:8-oxo-dGTP pyrophosphatase MutT (NUDIX family)